MTHPALAMAKPYLDSYGYAALFGLVFVEGFGIPAPGETVIIAGALLADQGTMTIQWVLTTAWAGAVLGDNLGYAIGHFAGRRFILRFGDHFGVHAKQLNRVERFFDRYGGVVVALARFVDGPRQLNGLVAGSIGMAWWRFLLYNAIGATFWVALWGGGVFLFGERVGPLLADHRQLAKWVLALSVSVLAALIAIWLRTHPKHHGTVDR